MKLLLDENLPHQLRHEITGHDVRTVAYMGWSGVRNGVPLAAAVRDSFDALLTLDEGILYEQNLSKFPIAIVVLHAPSNALEDLEPLIPEILKQLSSVSPGTVAHVP